MRTSTRKTLIKVVVACLVAGGAVVVWQWLFTCGSLNFGQRDMLHQLQADPILATAPPNATLVNQRAQLGACDPNPEYDDPANGVTLASKLYRAPEVYDLAQLRGLFDQPAAAGGWVVETNVGETHPADPRFRDSLNTVTYCKLSGTHVVRAVVESPAPRGAVPAGTGVLVELTHHATGSPCGLP